jgi:hypothetical protein
MTNTFRSRPRPYAGCRVAGAILLSVAAVSAVGTGGGVVAAQAPNLCTLLTHDEVQALASDTITVDTGVANAFDAFGDGTCR